MATVAGTGLAVTAMAVVPDRTGTPLRAVGPVWSSPSTDIDALRDDAADEPARSDSGETTSAPSPSPSAEETPPGADARPSSTPTASPTGFPPVEGCSAEIPGDEVANGELGTEHLCEISDVHVLHPDAAAAFVALDAAYAEESGESLAGCVTDSYRSYEQQLELSARKPGLAAVPGTSSHGWGLAVDVGCGAETYDGELHEWLSRHAAEFGWHNPAWAQADGSRPEPWHWEFESRLLD